MRRRLASIEKTFGLKSDAYQNYKSKIETAFGANAISLSDNGKINIITKNINIGNVAQNKAWLFSHTQTAQQIISSYRKAYQKEHGKKGTYEQVKKYAQKFEKYKGKLTDLLSKYYKEYSTTLPDSLNFLHNKENSNSEIDTAINTLEKLLKGES